MDKFWNDALKSHCVLNAIICGYWNQFISLSIINPRCSFHYRSMHSFPLSPLLGLAVWTEFGIWRRTVITLKSRISEQSAMMTNKKHSESNIHRILCRFGEWWSLPSSTPGVCTWYHVNVRNEAKRMGITNPCGHNQSKGQLVNHPCLRDQRLLWNHSIQIEIVRTTVPLSMHRMQYTGCTPRKPECRLKDFLFELRFGAMTNTMNTTVWTEKFLFCVIVHSLNLN